MTTMQMLSLAAVLVAVALTYLPMTALKLPTFHKSSVLKQIESVVAVREAYTDETIVNACNALLQALLQVKK
jgi:hypothetical protein